MKKVCTILLLIVFAFNITGIYIVFKIHQYQIRKSIKLQIKNGVPENQLSVFTITNKNQHTLHWIKQNEFQLEGMLYDVVREEIKGSDTIIYYCVTDIQETTLFANLEKMVNEKSKPAKRTNSPVKNLIKILSSLYNRNNDFTFLANINNSGSIFNYSTIYSSPVITITSPPPKSII